MQVQNWVQSCYGCALKSDLICMRVIVFMKAPQQCRWTESKRKHFSLFFFVSLAHFCMTCINDTNWVFCVCRWISSLWKKNLFPNDIPAKCQWSSSSTQRPETTSQFLYVQIDGRIINNNFQNWLSLWPSIFPPVSASSAVQELCLSYGPPAVNNNVAIRIYFC